MYEPALQVDALVAIDTHVHVEIGDDGHTALPQAFVDAASAYFRSSVERPGLDAIAEIYRERHMAAVVFTVDARTQLGYDPNSSVEIARGAARNSDVLIPFGSVDPLRTDALDLARRLIDEEGVRGFKFHPTVQGFSPDDPTYFPLYELIASHGLPAIFHSGQTGIGAGMPGGGGLSLALSNPMLLDAVAASLPEFTIVLAHPAVPWQDEQLSVLTHKPNVWMDLSGWSPKYFSSDLVRQARSLLQDKVLFGSDFPLIHPDRWLRDFEALEFRPEVRQKILKDNAVRLLGLAT